MKDFQLRNDTKLLFRNDAVADLAALASGKKVLFVFGGGSVKKNGCYEDVKKAVESADGIFYELADASRELEAIEKGIRLVKEHDIELVIGAGGANIMDCAKLIAFGAYHTEDLWDYVKGKKNPYGLQKLSLILMPTYPSSGSEYGLGGGIGRLPDWGFWYCLWHCSGYRNSCAEVFHVSWSRNDSLYRAGYAGAIIGIYYWGQKPSIL